MFSKTILKNSFQKQEPNKFNVFIYEEKYTLNILKEIKIFACKSTNTLITKFISLESIKGCSHRQGKLLEANWESGIHIYLARTSLCNECGKPSHALSQSNSPTGYTPNSVIPKIHSSKEILSTKIEELSLEANINTDRIQPIVNCRSTSK